MISQTEHVTLPNIIKEWLKQADNTSGFYVKDNEIWHTIPRKSNSDPICRHKFVDIRNGYIRVELGRLVDYSSRTPSCLEKIVNQPYPNSHRSIIYCNQYHFYCAIEIYVSNTDCFDILQIAMNDHSAVCGRQNDTN